jgi:hypothetical protein
MAKRAFPETFLVSLIAHAAIARTTWSRTWLMSGAAVLSYLLLAGSVHDRRVLPWAPLSILLLLLNLAVAASSTSWLFFALFTTACWPMVFLTSLFQFDMVANWTRKALRKVLHFMHFAADTIALFDLPALEIDVDVAGLMVIRGITLQLSSLTLIAHGIEVGIKLSDDMELALQTDRVTVQLFRRIQIADVYANVKGGAHEQTFAELEDDTRDGQTGEVLMDQDRPLTRAAMASVLAKSQAVDEAERLAEESDLSRVATEPLSPLTDAETPVVPPRRSATEQNMEAPLPKTTMKERMTDGRAPEVAEASEVIQKTTSVVGDDAEAQRVMQERIQRIFDTSEVQHAERRARRIVERTQGDQSPTSKVNMDNDRHVRAAICSQLHRKASVQHPPQHSIRVSTLQHLAPPWVQRLLHRSPMLLRALLNPLAYFHPITANAVTAGASGTWIKTALGSEMFKNYADKSGEIRSLRDRAFGWLSDANFVVGLHEFSGQGMVPFDPSNDIVCRMAVDEITLYRTVPHQSTLKKAVQLGGADATVIVPSMLLPHHDHLLPSAQERSDQQSEHRQRIKRHDSTPKVVQERRSLAQNIRDEVDCTVSVHLRLPAVFDQELLNFISALVKASKVIEFERTLEQNIHSDIRSMKDLAKMINTGLRENVKKATVNAAANDQWIAKLVGKVTKKLETAQGDVGYSGNLPVKLKPYREAGLPYESKLLP